METKEFEKIAKKCVMGLQKLQMSIIFDENLCMQIDTGGYKNSIHVSVFIGAHEIGAKRRLVTFGLNPWDNEKNIENKYKGCIALVNAHRS